MLIHIMYHAFLITHNGIICHIPAAHGKSSYLSKNNITNCILNTGKRKRRIRRGEEKKRLRKVGKTKSHLLFCQPTGGNCNSEFSTLAFHSPPSISCSLAGREGSGRITNHIYSLHYYTTHTLITRLALRRSDAVPDWTRTRWPFWPHAQGTRDYQEMRAGLSRVVHLSSLLRREGWAGK